jgi:hypothetical protein
MQFRVLRPFVANGKQLNRGDVISIEPSGRTQTLVDTRYLVPTDAVVAADYAPEATLPQKRQANKKG